MHNWNPRPGRCTIATVLIAALGLLACGSQPVTSTAPTTAPTTSNPSPTPAGPASPAPTLAGLDVDSSFVGGASARGTVTLSAAAPSAGFQVALSSSDSVLTVPGSLSIPAGSMTSTFEITSRTVTSGRDVTVTATAGGETRSAVARVRSAAVNMTLEP